MSKSNHIYALLKEKKYEEVEVLCKQIIVDAKAEGNEDEEIRARTYQGIAYTRQFQYHKSLSVFEGDFERIQQVLGVKWNGKELVQTFMAYHMLDRAKDYLKGFLRVDQGNAEANFLMAGIHMKQHAYEEAKEILERLVLKYPNHHDILFLLGTSYENLNDFDKAFELYERALIAGNNSALHGIFNLLFEREGICDYSNCPSTCCKGVMLKGTDGRNICDEKSLQRLIKYDYRNTNWIYNKSDDKGQWIFECKHHLPGNVCGDYENRPQTCHDYPSNLLVKKDGCSYRFGLRKNMPFFKDITVLSAVLEILNSGGYSKAVNEIAESNIDLINGL